MQIPLRSICTGYLQRLANTRSTVDKFVYIDESGSPTLDKDHYVLSACFVSREHLDKILDRRNQVSKEYFSGSEIKSSSIGGNIQRRKKVAQALSGLDARFELLVIKKERLAEDGGFRFKKSMYKYCQRRLFQKIYRGFDNIGVVVDSFGDREFRTGFGKYIDEHYQPTLFSSKGLTFATPTEQPLLQLSDFVAGTVRRYFNRDDDPSAFSILKSIINNLEVWPRVVDDESVTSPDEELDTLVRNHCAHVAEEYLASNRDPVLSEAVEFLLYSSATDNAGFIFGDLILEHLQEMGLVGHERDKGWLRQSVIAPLRENGVLIAASREGYKIPENLDDLDHFVKFVSNKTIKYLDRVVMMRDSIYYGTKLQHDMLASSPELQKLLRPLEGDSG